MELRWVSEYILLCMKKVAINKAFFNLRRKHFLISWIISDLLCCGINLPNDTNILLWIMKAMEVVRQWQTWKNCAKHGRTKQDLTSASNLQRWKLRHGTRLLFFYFFKALKYLKHSSQKWYWLKKRGSETEELKLFPSWWGIFHWTLKHITR